MKTGLIALLVLASPAVARGQAAPEESLKIVHSLLTQAVNSGNVDAVTNLVHPQAVGFFRDSARLVQLRSDYGPTQVLPAVIADLAKFSSTPIDTVFRVVGEVGIVSIQMNQDAKEFSGRDRYLRSSYIYVRVKDAWRLVSWHTSDTPLKR
jgi:hypothetical protein